VRLAASFPAMVRQDCVCVCVGCEANALSGMAGLTQVWQQEDATEIDAARATYLCVCPHESVEEAGWLNTKQMPFAMRGRHEL
jgi:hypothetical protein